MTQPIYLMGLQNMAERDVQEGDQGIRVVSMAPRDGVPRGILVLRHAGTLYRAIFHGRCPLHVPDRLPEGLKLI